MNLKPMNVKKEPNNETTVIPTRIELVSKV